MSLGRVHRIARASWYEGPNVLVSGEAAITECNRTVSLCLTPKGTGRGNDVADLDHSGPTINCSYVVKVRTAEKGRIRRWRYQRFYNINSGKVFRCETIDRFRWNARQT